MILYYSNNFKAGLKVIFEKLPFYIENVQFVKPGKGRTFSRVKLRNLFNKQLIEKTFRSTDFLVSADIIDCSLIYIYNDNKFWYFMDPITFDQVSVEKSIIQKYAKWLVEQDEYTVTLWNKKPISIIMTNFVELQVISTTLITHSDLVANPKNTKLCKLKTGAVIHVPLFIQVGDIVKIDIRTEKYHSRVNK